MDDEDTAVAVARDMILPRCHNPILGYSLNFTFFKIKNQKNKIKAGNVEKADKKGLQKQAKIKLQFSEEFQGLIVPYYAQEQKNANSKVKLNDYWTNLHKN